MENTGFSDEIELSVLALGAVYASALVAVICWMV